MALLPLCSSRLSPPSRSSWRFADSSRRWLDVDTRLPLGRLSREYAFVRLIASRTFRNSSRIAGPLPAGFRLRRLMRKPVEVGKNACDQFLMAPILRR